METLEIETQKFLWNLEVRLEVTHKKSSRLVRGISLLVNASVINVEVGVTFGLDVKIWGKKKKNQR